MATKILISFYCPDFSSTGIVKTSFDKVYDCRKFSEHCKTNWHDPKIEKGAPSDLQIRKATVLGGVTIAWNLYKGRVQVIAPILLQVRHNVQFIADRRSFTHIKRAWSRICQSF